MSASTQRKNRLAEIEAGTYKKQTSLKQQDEKKAKEKRTAIICSAVVVVIVLAAILLNLIPALQRRAELRRYTDGVAVTIGDRDYSPAEINYYYGTQFNSFANNYGFFYGLDASQGPVGLGSMAYTGPAIEGKNLVSWRDYFLDATYQQLSQVQELLKYARENNITLTDEEKQSVEDEISSFSSYAVMYGFTDVDQFLSAYYGTGFTQETMRTLNLESALANKAYTSYQDSLSFTPEELAEEFASFNGDYDSYSFATYTVTVRETENEDESELAERLVQHDAEEIIKAYNESEAEDLYERFNAYIEQELGESATRRDNTSGQYLDELYAEWLKDEARQAGDLEQFSDEDGNCTLVLFLDHASAAYPTVNVRHILIKAEQGEDGTWSDEALAAAQAEAERILAEFESGDKTEESFAALAGQYSEDPGSAENGGLYENVHKGQMVPEFEDFCFAEGRQVGDTGIVYGTNGGYAGYHVMYYVGEGRMYSDVLAENTLISEAMSSWLESAALTVTPGPEEALVDPVTGPVVPAADEALPEDEAVADEETAPEE
ncbi:MAG: peptidylprolyl isomerase [Oscillospiraceae bacterium]|nr:peptidylprolyl isomerase [Oscillospiraceae bacterium]